MRRPFVVLWLATLLFYLGFQLLLPVIPLYAAQLGAGEAHVGFIIGVFALAAMVPRPIAGDLAARDAEQARLVEMAAFAHDLGLEVHAGHGLTYHSVGPVAAIPQVMELNIGHFLVGEAIFVGLEAAIHRMRAAMDEARRDISRQDAE